MEPASLALGTISVMELCIRAGKDMSARCRAYKRAEQEIQEANLRIQGHWIKIEHQLSALQAVWKALSVDYQLHQSRVLQVLQGKLQAAHHRLDILFADPQHEMAVVDGATDTRRSRVISTVSNIKRLKYATYAKAALVSIIDDLEKWQKEFDPSWFFLSRMGVPIIDQELTGKRAAENNVVSTVVRLREAHKTNKDSGPGGPTSVFLQAGYEIHGRKRILFSSAYTGRNLQQEPLIIDNVPVRDSTEVERKIRDVRDLARVLATVDPEIFGLLSCHGVIKVLDSLDNPNGFDFVFPLPLNLRHTQPHSLRFLLSNQTRQYSLNERVALAASLARSVVFLHSSGFVHKNISPENIVICQSSADTLGTPVLVGFDQFRPAEGQTYKTGDSLWEKNLYRHPGRQGRYPEDEYVMQHDIYSVGVCLLEIGLWTSFVTYGDDKQTTSPGSSLAIGYLILARDQRRAATEIKQMLVKLALSRLPPLMGRIYTDVVVSCLTCLDKGNDRFGDKSELEDEDGIKVGVRYIEKVIFEIEKIVV